MNFWLTGLLFEHILMTLGNKEPTMFYPEEMTQDEIMEFEYEINRRIDIERGEGQFWAENAELQEIAEQGYYGA